MVDLQMARNASQIEAIDIHLNRLFAQAVRVASGLWGGGVLALAMHAFVTLGTSASLPGSVLAVGSFTVGAFHLSILPHPIRHSPPIPPLKIHIFVPKTCKEIPYKSGGFSRYKEIRLFFMM